MRDEEGSEREWKQQKENDRHACVSIYTKYLLLVPACLLVNRLVGYTTGTYMHASLCLYVVAVIIHGQRELARLAMEPRRNAAL